MVRNSVVGRWKTDDVVESCERCSLKFTLTRRRHHCRYCGCIFCAACANVFVRIPQLKVVNPQRICLTCLDMFSMTSGATAEKTKSLGNSSVEARASSSPIMCVGGASNGNSSFNESENETQLLEDDVASSGDDVSVAVAGVYSSVEDGQHTNSIQFLTALQENVKCSGGSNVLNVLMYVSEEIYQVTLITLGEDETMSAVAERLVESYSRLENGPFKPFTADDRKLLLERLHFTSESALIEKELMSTELASCCTHIVLSTLSETEMKKIWENAEHERSVICNFFRTEDRSENDDSYGLH